MADVPILTQQTIRVSLIFAALILGFGFLSNITGWPDKAAWGLVVIASLIVAALPLAGPLLAFLRDSGATIEVKGVKFDFSKSAIRGARMERANFQDNPVVPVTNSDAPSIAQAAKATMTARVVVVDLGMGKSWYPTRLFALAAAADKYRSVQALVILAQQGGVSGRFIGWLTPKNLLEAFCQDDSRYRSALQHARAILLRLELGGDNRAYPVGDAYQADINKVNQAYAETGDLAFVPALIASFQDSSSPVESLENPELPRWLSREEAERLLDPWLIRDNVRENMSAREHRDALCRTGVDFLAVIGEDGCYRGMIEVAAVIRSMTICPSSP